VFHNHVGSYVETEAETARLLEETNPDYVGWCFVRASCLWGCGCFSAFS
jgi:inosose dehydratase